MYQSGTPRRMEYVSFGVHCACFIHLVVDNNMSSVIREPSLVGIRCASVTNPSKLDGSALNGYINDCKHIFVVIEADLITRVSGPLSAKQIGNNACVLDRMTKQKRLQR